MRAPPVDAKIKLFTDACLDWLRTLNTPLTFISKLSSGDDIESITDPPAAKCITV